MRVSLVILLALCACSRPSVDDKLPVFSSAYNAAFARLGTLGLADTQTRVERLGEAGKAFRPELEALQRRQHEVNDAIVKAVEMKKKAVTDNDPASVEAATTLLRGAANDGGKIAADITAFNARLTAAGAPVIEARDPNARD